MLSLCVLPTAIPQFKRYIRDPKLSRVITIALIALTAVLVVGRILSGVHWLTDIVGGVLLSAFLIALHQAADSQFSA